jgi:hypothetical protein
VRLGLDWLVEHGDIAIVGEEADEVHLAPGSGRAGADLKGAKVRLRSLLEETSAYRAHFLSTPAEAVVRP